MSYSSKTIICSKNVPAAILTTSSLKLIVITQDPQFVSMADSVAQQTPMGIDRIVVWIKELDVNQLMQEFLDLPGNLNNILAFTLSTINKVAFIIHEGDTINEIRMDRAFIEAGKTQYN